MKERKKSNLFYKSSLVKGISLITLVITIIIVIILAGAVILSLANNNPIESADKAVFKQDASSYRDELNLYITSQYSINTGNYNPDTLNATSTSDPSIKDVIASMKDSDTTRFEIQNGELVFTGEAPEADWAAELGIEATNATPPTGYPQANAPVTEGSVGTPLNENSTINGESPSYNNPVIPAKFFAVNTTTASWNLSVGIPQGWNDGLVIQDATGNQFVWVPVDGVSVPYQSWTTYGALSYTQAEDIVPTEFNQTGITTTYKGFYVSRYEAAFDYNSGSIRVASKKSTGTDFNDWSASRDVAHTGYLWNNITFNDSKSYSEEMALSYGYTTAGTNLITGTEWDTIMKWFQNASINLTDSASWGNYTNSVPPADLSENGVYQVSGYTDFWKAKNIYDLAGNLWEWTCESDKSLPSYSVIRGGDSVSRVGGNNTAVYRDSYNSSTDKDFETGFRVALYIK